MQTDTEGKNVMETLSENVVDHMFIVTYLINKMILMTKPLETLKAT